MHVPFLDLTRQVAALRAELDEAYGRVLAGGRFVLGGEGEQFEDEFARACGVGHAVGVASGTDALTIALAAAGVGAGDEVVTAANTCVPTIVGIEHAGATPVLADVERETLTLDPADVKRVLTERTRAIVPVHLYGQVADMAPLLELARERRLVVVEDCAQAHGAALDGRPAGSLGHAAAFSFYPTKNLGALGDAGAVVTDDAELAARARLLRNYGEQARFEHVARGWNSRLDELQAAFLRAQLPSLGTSNERRRAIAAVYAEALAGTAIEAPAEAQGRHHVYHLYVARAQARDAFRARLAERGVETAVHYPTPVHLQPAYRALAPSRRPRVTEEAAAQIVSIPLHSALTDDDVAYVAAALSASARA